MYGDFEERKIRPIPIRPVFFPFFLFCAAFILASCATPPFHADEARIIPDDFFGIVPSTANLVPEDFPFLDELNAVWLRRTCRWSSLESSPGNWDFSYWDAYVDACEHAGKKLLLILAYDTPWIYEEKDAPRRISSRELPQYLNYVETVVRRYRGKIGAYEIWNEPNSAEWYGSPEEFITMTRAAIHTIRSIDPDVTILAGSFLRLPKGMIRKMVRAGVFDEADGLSFHPYALGPSGAVRLCDSLLELLAGENFSGEIWITEMGYPTRGWYPTRVPEEKFPSHIVKTLTGLAVRNVRGLQWYELFDSGNPGDYKCSWDSEDFFGLAYPNKTVKAGYHAFALCGKNLAGKEYRPELPLRVNLPGRTVSLCFTGEGNTLILWNERGASFPARIILPGTDQRLYDIRTGKYIALGEETEITVAKTPLVFTWNGNSPSEPAALAPELIKLK